jgi:hypothetical protein
MPIFDAKTQEYMESEMYGQSTAGRSADELWDALLAKGALAAAEAGDAETAAKLAGMLGARGWTVTGNYALIDLEVSSSWSWAKWILGGLCVAGLLLLAWYFASPRSR